MTNPTEAGTWIVATKSGIELLKSAWSLLPKGADKDAIAHKIPGIDIDILELLYKDTSRKFRAVKLRNVDRKIKLQEMRTLLRKSQIPILLTDTSLFGDEERLPHWIVLTGYSGSNWYVNNPLADSPNTRVDENRLSANLGYRGVRCAVIVRGTRKYKSTGKSHVYHRWND